MFRNYLLVAFRGINKQKLFTSINIIGLVLGLVALILTNVIISYEEGYDRFFPNGDRIYAVVGELAPTSGLSGRFGVGIYAAVQPLIEANVAGVEHSARLWRSERVARVGDKRFYQTMRFADPEFLNIFALDFVAGDAANALVERNGVILSETAARKYFGDTDPFGQLITIDNQLELSVTGVIRDLPKNSHFTNSLVGARPFEMIANIDILDELWGVDVDAMWRSDSTENITYVMLEEGVATQEINQRLSQMHADHAPERATEFHSNYSLIPFTDLNTAEFVSAGLPIPQSIRLIGVLILLVAIINYTNLANAQYMGRIREIGLRKSLGAGRSQLIMQFLTESVAISTLAMVIALALSALALAPLSDISGRAFNLDSVLTIPGLAVISAIALFTGILGGIYPAMKISKTPAASCLSDHGIQGRGRSRLRGTIVAFQFGVAIILASAASVISTQNQYLDQESAIFDRDHIVLLDRIGRQGVFEKYETMKTELLRIPGVESVTASNNVPFEQSRSRADFARERGDVVNEARFLIIYNDHDFMSTYEIPIIAGRDFARDAALDTLLEAVDGEYQQAYANVILNRMATEQLGWASPEEAIGGSFFYSDIESPSIELHVAGVVDDMNYMGFHNEIVPMIFELRPAGFGSAAIRVSGQNINETVRQIDAVWDEINPDYPLERSFLDDEFNFIGQVYSGFEKVLGGLALVAVFVAFIGLFGLSAFMTRSRTKEIGIRKILGASVGRLMRLLMLQISVPVLVSIFFAAPLAWAAMELGYLQLFSDRIGNVAPIVSIAAVAVLALAWGVVSVHAWRVARANPILALRHT